MKLKVAIIVGSERENRKSIFAVKLVEEIGKTIEEIETVFVDPVELDITDEDTKIPEYSKITEEADAFFIVTPEYNHGYPGILKTLMDTELKNYIHKPVAIAGVSSGIYGGARVIENLLPVLREYGLVTTFKDMHFPRVQELFDVEGNLLNPDYEDYIHKSYNELIWMAKSLKWGRENL